MHFTTLVSLASLAFARSALAQCTAIWPEICDVQNGVGGSNVVPGVLPRFEPIGLLDVAYGNVVLGAAQQFSPARSSSPPVLSFNSSEPITSRLVLMMVDADASPPMTLQWMAINVEVDATTLALGDGSLVAPYVGPQPPIGDSPHRYLTLLYAQPANFTLPTSLATLPASELSGGRLGFDLLGFTTANGLGDPIGGQLFKSAADTGGAETTTAPSTQDAITRSVTGETVSAAAAEIPTAQVTSDPVPTATSSGSMLPTVTVTVYMQCGPASLVTIETAYPTSIAPTPAATAGIVKRRKRALRMD